MIFRCCCYLTVITSGAQKCGRFRLGTVNLRKLRIILFCFHFVATGLSVKYFMLVYIIITIKLTMLHAAVSQPCLSRRISSLF